MLDLVNMSGAHFSWHILNLRARWQRGHGNIHDTNDLVRMHNLGLLMDK